MPDENRKAEREFLFVNKNPSSKTLSTTRSDLEDLRTITNHAQRWRVANAKKQKVKLSRLGARNAQSIVGWQSRGMVQPGNDRSPPTEISSSTQPTAPSPTTASMIRGNSTNPFLFAESAEDVWWTHSPLQYATSIWLPTIFKSIVNFDHSRPFGHDPAMHKLIRACLSSKMHMYSLLAASTGRLKFVQKLTLQRTDSPEYCTANAIRFMREYLSSFQKADEQVVFDLIALSTFEGYVGNYEGARTHLRMVQHLAASLGGFELMEPSLRGLCWMRDMLIASITAQAPIFPLTWDPGPVTPLLLQSHKDEFRDTHEARLGQGLSQAMGNFSSALRSIVHDLVHYTRVFHQILGRKCQEARVAEWATCRGLALRHRLLSLPDAQEDSSFSTSRLQKCLRLALIIWLSGIATGSTLRSHPARRATYSSETVTRNVTRLRDGLTDIAQSTTNLSTQHRDLIFWMIYLGSSEATEASDKEWFCSKLVVQVRHRGLNDMEQLSQLLASYLSRVDEFGRPEKSHLAKLLGWSLERDH